MITDKYLKKQMKEEELDFEEYKKMTNEEIEYQIGWSDTNEFSWGYSIYAYLEIIRLHSIIKEVREYIESNFDKSGVCVSGSDLPYSYIEELLEILDKVGDKE